MLFKPGYYLNVKVRYQITITMKKKILNFALVAMMIGSVAAGCSSEKNGSDSTAVDTTGMDSAQKAKVMRKQMKKDTARPAKTLEDTLPSNY